MSHVTLYGYWRSSASYRVRIALAWKGVEYTYKPVNLLASEQKSEEFLKRNPLGYVPALEIDGEVFTESLALFELLDGLYPDRPLLPSEPRARAHVLAACHVIASGIQPLQNLNVLARLPLDADGKKAWVQHFMGQGFQALEKMLAAATPVGEGPYALGAFSALDACIAPQMYASRRFEVDVTPYPRIRAAHEAALLLPAVQASVPENQIDAVL